MAGAILGFNEWLKKCSGLILVSAIILALGNILGFTGSVARAVKDAVLDDVYESLYKIENNDLKHIDLSLEYLQKGNALNLNIQTGNISKEDALKTMLEIDQWYIGQLE
jgi:hypothetical protein